MSESAGVAAGGLALGVVAGAFAPRELGAASSALAGAFAAGPSVEAIFGTTGASGTSGGFGDAAPAPGGAEAGGFGKVLGGLDGVVSDFNATAVAALGPTDGVRLAPGWTGATDGLVDGAPALDEGAGFGATEEFAGAVSFGSVAEDAGARGCGNPGVVEGMGALGGDELAVKEAPEELPNGVGDVGFGAAGALVVAPGARDALPALAGFAASGGAGIDVSPVAGPGPSGAGGCTGIVVAGAGGASSRQLKPSASKLRKVLRPQIGHSQPTSKRFCCASIVCAGARSRTRSRPIAKPART